MVNVVTFKVAEAMNLTSGDYEISINEFELAKLTTRPSQVVRPPQVAESPVSFECKLNRIIDFGSEPPSGSLVIGEIVGSPRGGGFKGTTTRPGLAGSDWTHGRRTVFPYHRTL